MASENVPQTTQLEEGFAGRNGLLTGYPDDQAACTCNDPDCRPCSDRYAEAIGRAIEDDGIRLLACPFTAEELAEAGRQSDFLILKGGR